MEKQSKQAQKNERETMKAGINDGAKLRPKSKKAIHAEAAKATKLSAGKIGKKPAAKGGAKKAPAKAAPKAKKEGGAPRKGRALPWPDDAKITVLVKENPKRKGTAAFDKFARYSRVKTVGEFKADGGVATTLHYDLDHEFIKIG